MNEALTPRAQRVIEMAATFAKSLDHNYVGVEHLLLGLVRCGGLAGDLLAAKVSEQEILDAIRGPGHLTEERIREIVRDELDAAQATASAIAKDLGLVPDR
jgi:ATP-dependent Clp protease ATP-binding subunit ClpA